MVMPAISPTRLPQASSLDGSISAARPSSGSSRGRTMFRVLIGLVTVLLMSTSIQAQQASRVDDIVKRGTLRVGLTGDYLPFSYFDPANQKFHGFDVDMAEALGKALGV